MATLDLSVSLDEHPSCLCLKGQQNCHKVLLAVCSVSPKSITFFVCFFSLVTAKGVCVCKSVSMLYAMPHIIPGKEKMVRSTCIYLSSEGIAMSSNHAIYCFRSGHLTVSLSTALQMLL